MRRGDGDGVFAENGDDKLGDTVSLETFVRFAMACVTETSESDGEEASWIHGPRPARPLKKGIDNENLDVDSGNIFGPCPPAGLARRWSVFRYLLRTIARE